MRQDNHKAALSLCLFGIFPVVWLGLFSGVLLNEESQ